MNKRKNKCTETETEQMNERKFTNKNVTNERKTKGIKKQKWNKLGKNL